MTTNENNKPRNRETLQVVQGAGQRTSPLDLLRKDCAFCPRELVLATLPHSNPGNVPAYQRRNGNLTLTIQPGIDTRTGQSFGFPYGSIPRLLLFYLATQAIKTKSRRIELGRTLADFMRELGLNPKSGGRKSAAHYLRDQMTRLLTARITFSEVREIGPKATTEIRADMLVACRSVLWWTPEQPEQGDMWGSFVELGEDFYNAITRHPIPARMSVLRALKKSPLALDLYALLTREAARACQSKQGRFIPWRALMAQLGTDYAEARNFGTKARAALRKIEAAYPNIKLGSLEAGITIGPDSLPDIPSLMADRLKDHAGTVEPPPEKDAGTVDGLRGKGRT